MRAEFSSTDPNADTVRQQVVTDAVDRFFASIEFDLEGTILRANQNFLNALEYDLAEIVGEKHSLFVDKDYGHSQEYEDFWEALRSGTEMQGQFPRVTKSGSIIWIQATYAPVLDEAGKVVKVIKIASDVTARRTAVDKLSDGLVAMSRGDFKHRVLISEDNELFALSNRFNSTLEHFSGFLDVVSSVATGLESASMQMEQRSDQAAKTALKNAATFEETSAEVDMVSESIDTSSRSVKDAQLNTDEAAQLADVSAVSMANALDATIAMRKATTEMSGINEVIDSIAFQTNLLALNAGIEAARAGPSGAGFAVVATEIRNLAGRSQDASSRIQALISRSVQQAKTTENYVQESEGNLRNVKNKSRDVADTMVTLSQETKEQSDRVGMINRTIRELAVGGEKDAQLASENQEVSNGLAGFSKQLLEELKSLSQ